MSRLESKDVVLVVMNSFESHGRDPVSLAEFLQAVERVNEQLGLTYEFMRNSHYSIQLFEDLDKLSFDGYIHHRIHRHDGYLPKRFLALTEMGENKASKLMGELPDSATEIIESAVHETIVCYRDKWKLWGRDEAPRSEVGALA
jgi:hypothetical protein